MVLLGSQDCEGTGTPLSLKVLYATTWYENIYHNFFLSFLIVVTICARILHYKSASSRFLALLRFLLSTILVPSAPFSLPPSLPD